MPCRLIQRNTDARLAPIIDIAVRQRRGLPGMTQIEATLGLPA